MTTQAAVIFQVDSTQLDAAQAKITTLQKTPAVINIGKTASSDVDAVTASFNKLSGQIDPVIKLTNQYQDRLSQLQTFELGYGKNVNDLRDTMTAKYKASIAALSSGSGSGLSQLVSSFKNVADGADKSSISISSTAREIHALIDELSSGRTSQSFGTFTRLLTNGLGLGAGALAGVGAVGLGVGAVAGYGYLQHQNTLATTSLNNSNIAYASPVSSSTEDALAAQLSGGIGKGSSFSTDAILAMEKELVKLQAVSASTFEPMTKAVLQFSVATGDSLDQSTQAFDGFSTDAVTGYTKVAKTLGIYNSDIAANIANQTDQSAAVSMALTAIGARTNAATDSTFGFGKAWAQVKDDITGGIQTNIKNVEDLQAKYDALKATIDAAPAGTGAQVLAQGVGQAQLNTLGQQLDAAKAKLAAENSTASSNDKSQAVNKEIEGNTSLVASYNQTQTAQDALYTESKKLMQEYNDMVSQGIPSITLGFDTLGNKIVETTAQIKAAADLAAQAGANLKTPAQLLQSQLTRQGVLAATPPSGQAQAQITASSQAFKENLQQNQKSSGLDNTAIDAATAQNTSNLLTALNTQQTAYITTLTTRTSAELALADTMGKGADAYAKQTVVGQIAEQVSSGAIQQGYAQIAINKTLIDQAASYAAATAHQTDLQRDQVAGLKSIADAGAGGNPAQLAELQRQQALDVQFKPQIGAATAAVAANPNDAGAQQALNVLLQSKTAQDALTKSALQYTTQINFDKVTESLQQGVDVKKLEASTWQDTYEQQRSALDDLTIKQQLFNQGISETSTGYQAQYDKLKQLKQAGNDLEDHSRTVQGGLESEYSDLAKSSTDYGAAVKSGLNAAVDDTSTALSTLATTGKLDFNSFAIGMLTDITNICAKLLVQKALMEAIGDISGSGGSGAGSLFSGIFGSSASAGTGVAEGDSFAAAEAAAPVAISRGAAFSGRGEKLMATGGVLDTPTYFPMASGEGLAGEAGDEGVVPLTRLPNGKLGVGTSGGGVSSSVVNITPSVTINNPKGNANDIGRETTQQMTTLMKGIIQQELKNQVRPGNILNQTVRSY